LTDFYRFISACYFSIATLSTVGYGDLYPVTNLEKCVTMCIMMVGVVFFSFMMSSFIQIISMSNLNINVGPDESQIIKLHNWLVLLARFRENKPIPSSLYRQINEHYTYFWT